MANNQQQNNQNQDNVVFKLEKCNATVREQTYGVEVEASVLVDNKPKQDVEVNFLKIGKATEHLGIRKTNKKGVVRINIGGELDEESKDVKIEASISEQGKKINRHIDLTFPGKVKSYVKKVEIKKVGKDGKYFINIQTINNSGVGVKCDIIFTQESDEGCCIIPQSIPGAKYLHKRQAIIPTDDEGFLSIKLEKFTDRKRAVLVQIKNTDVDKLVELNGPDDVVYYKKDEGFWETIKRNFFN